MYVATRSLHSKWAHVQEPAILHLIASLGSLQHAGNFADIREDIASNSQPWLSFASEMPKSLDDVPKPWSSTLTIFEKVLLIHAVHGRVVSG